MDVAKRVIDLGYHPSTVYFPLVVEEAMMVEPTETETKETLDAFADGDAAGGREAHERPGPAPRGARDDAGAPPGRGSGRPAPQAPLVGLGPLRSEARGDPAWLVIPDHGALKPPYGATDTSSRRNERVGPEKANRR